ncbi:MAG: hypothetical protein V3U92_19745 [Cellulophaga sp.]
MNISFEIANETLIGLNQTMQEFMQICNAGAWEEIKSQIIHEIWKHAIIANLSTIAISVIMLGLGWFLAGWYFRKLREPRPRKGGRESTRRKKTWWELWFG